jgi:hypothetical protein
MVAQIYSQVSDLMIDTVDFYPRASVNKFNEPTYGTVVSIRGRLMNDKLKTRTLNGIEVTDVGRFITYGPHAEITVNHKMVSGSSTYTIYDIDTLGDENGDHHTVISFGH